MTIQTNRKEIELIEEDTKQNIKVSLCDNEHIEFMVYDYAKKNMKTFYILLKKDNLNKLKELIK